MRKYRTFMICSEREGHFIRTVTAPSGIRITVETDPSRRHSCAPNGTISSIRFGPQPPEKVPPASDTLASHIEVWARSDHEAEEFARLIWLGCMLAFPDPHEQPSWRLPLAAQAIGRQRLDKAGIAEWFAFIRGADVGCASAVAAREDRSLVYALEKHALSLRLDSFTPHSAGAQYGRVFPECYEDARYHTTAAFAVVAAFSVVEELGLEVRSSSERPRFLQNSPPVWNPEVLADLGVRLSAIGLSTDDQFRWLIRGGDNELRNQLEFPEESTINPYGVRGVADRLIPLADAIDRASYLRNTMSAHRFSSFTSRLGPYEVHNCQVLARHLLAAALGLNRHPRWRSDA